jgi:hypothetical protein
MSDKIHTGIYSNASTCSAAPNLNDIMRLMKSMPPPPDKTEFVMHPNNAKLFPAAKSPAAFASPLYGIPVHFDKAIPERKLRTKWHPPKGSRFVEYGPEDEPWMRPLGLGSVETVDDGPLIVEVNRSAMERMERSLEYLDFRNTRMICDAFGTTKESVK